ncbi:MAG: 4Fe-4S dicluster domain-containing protein [Leptospiraceae bacterium]|nr:4Fe-4S dicluster domain-containing protein [Leptospiraceae bacterium]MCP5495075.1 4Fe-4S dicluster domain-containing protein [Leptospiraceae bacterium]
MDFPRILFHILFIVFFIAANVIFVKAVLYRLKLVFSGKDARGTEDFKKHPNLSYRLKTFVTNVVLQKKLMKEPLRGIMHIFIFAGFLVYMLHTTNQIIAGIFGWGLDDPYQFSILGFLNQSLDNFYENIVQIFSFLVLTGLIYFAWRRWVKKAKGLDIPSTASAIVIFMISLLMISTILGAGAKFVPDNHYYEAGHINPISTIVASIWSGIGVTGESADIAFKVLWWVHILTVFSFMVYVPTSKHGHLIYAPINFFLVTDTPKGAISKMEVDFETFEGTFGVNKIQDFPWPNLLDGLACIECGRCQVQCPANRTGKALNPKAIIVNLKHAMMEKMPVYLEAKAKAEKEPDATPETIDAALAELETDVVLLGKHDPAVDNVITSEELWACTTCYACVEACPVGNNQVSAIIEMRRYLSFSELPGSIPKELRLALDNIGNDGRANPWGIGYDKRADWAQGLDIKLMADDSNVDYLYWVGCAGAFDDRNVKVAQAFTKILKKANINFGILGTEERCTGDSARRGGNEYTYWSLATYNIEILNNYNVKKIITTCPHCFNTLKNEYPQYGGNYEVIHHSEFINYLLKEKKIDVAVADELKNITYHDSCYLGRYNDNYDNPRDVVKAVSGSEVKEASDNHSKSLCCGAGGAQMWMEEEGERVNNKRTKQLVDTGATTIAVGCPFCMTMMSDGVKNLEKTDTVKVKDLAELVADNLK